MEAVNNLFNSKKVESSKPTSIWLLDMGDSGDYTNGHIVTCPGTYEWTDFERIEIFFGWLAYADGQSMEPSIITREQILRNPTGWFGRAHVDASNYGQFRAKSLSTGEIWCTGDTKLIGIKAYLKEEITYAPGLRIPLSTPKAISQSSVITLSESVFNFDVIEVELSAVHGNNLRHIFSGRIGCDTLLLNDRIKVSSYYTTSSADQIMFWFDLTSEKKFTVAAVNAGASWRDFELLSIKGIKEGTKTIEHFVGTPNPNSFINPNMNVWQETLGAETTVGIDQHHADGWFAVGHGALTAHKHTDAKGRNWMSLKGGGTNSWKAIGQCIEAEECLSLLDSDNKLTVSYMYQTTSNDTNTHVACVVLGAGSKDDFTTANLVEFALVDQPIIRDGKEHLVQFTINLKDFSGMNGLEIRLGSYNKASVNTPNPADSNLLITACKLEWGIHYTKCMQEKTRQELHDCQRFLEKGSCRFRGTPTSGSMETSVYYKATKRKNPQITLVGTNCNVARGDASDFTINSTQAASGLIGWTADARLKNA